MVRTVMIICFVATGLSACDSLQGSSHRDEAPTQFISANLAATTDPLVLTPPPPSQLRQLPQTRAPASGVIGVQAIQAANSGARQRSTPAGFINAVQYFDYMPGALYEVYTAPGYVTTISLQPDEKLITYAAGDTVRWVIGDVTGGSPAGQQTHVLIKPIRPDLRTNLVITTDRRVYLVEARSIQGNTYNAAIGWNYPQQSLVQHASSRGTGDSSSIARHVALKDLNFGYEISGDKPRWRPLRVFDDGRKTYIEFPPNLGTMEAPPLFVIGRHGDAQLVNYRVRGRYYEIDRLIDRAELRLGEAPQQIVRITAKTQHQSHDQHAAYQAYP